MKVSAPTLLPILRSDTVGDILAYLFLTPDERVTLADLSKAVGTLLPTVVREIDRMVAAGLLAAEKIGRARRVWPNQQSPLYEPLSELVALTYGPKPVLERSLAGIDGIERALIYGSWAARYRGEPGAAPNDVDVLVVGKPDADELFSAAEDARATLRREVNIRAVRSAAWSDPATEDAFLAHVRSRPIVELTGVGGVSARAEAAPQKVSTDTIQNMVELPVDIERLREVCVRYGIIRLDVFGSVSRGEARSDSDVDLLYSLAPDKRLGWAIEDLTTELTELLGRPVDLVSRRSLNQLIRDRVLSEARPLYAA